MHKQVGLICTATQSFSVGLMLRAIDRTMRHVPVPRLPVSVYILQQLCDLCATLGTWGVVLKAAMLLSFYGFFRQSNLAPLLPHQFDSTRHTTRGDVQLSPSGLRVALKWTKTLQPAMSPVHIPLPAIQGSSLCPLRAYRAMLHSVPSPSPRAPLLLLPSESGVLTVVTIHQLTTGFNTLCSRLHLPPHKYTFHSLRRGGATLAYQAGVPLPLIKTHGTWSSDAVYSYIQPSANTTSTVPRLLSQAVTSVSTTTPHP